MNPIRNPFKSMLLTYHPDRFYGREDEIISILQVITAPDPNSHAIYGIRSIGKTTLMKYLKDSHGALHRYREFISGEFQPGGERELLFVYINFHRFDGEDHVFARMYEEFLEELENGDHLIEDDTPLLPDLSPRQMASRQTCIEALRRALSTMENERRTRVVFLLDDFDTALDYLEIEDDGLLRSLSDYASLIIATEEPIPELRPDFGASSPLLGILRPEAIGLLTENAARTLVSHPASTANIHFGNTEENMLLNVAGRQPYLLTAACELYFDMRQEYPELAKQLQEITHLQTLQTQLIYRLLNAPHVNNVLQITWTRLRDEERRTLTEMVSSQSPQANLNLVARLITKALTYLDVKHNTYRIFSLIFVDFIRMQGAPNGNIPHRPIPETLDDVTEKLSPIDSALLTYLANNAGRVCTFDELLDAIWEDTDGSKKRALEAAVFRLRKTLNAQQQIKNIRGRGYKFVTHDTVQSG